MAKNITKADLVSDFIDLLRGYDFNDERAILDIGELDVDKLDKLRRQYIPLVILLWIQALYYVHPRHCQGVVDAFMHRYFQVWEIDGKSSSFAPFLKRLNAYSDISNDENGLVCIAMYFVDLAAVSEADKGEKINLLTTKIIGLLKFFIDMFTVFRFVPGPMDGYKFERFLPYDSEAGAREAAPAPSRGPAPGDDFLSELEGQAPPTLDEAVDIDALEEALKAEQAPRPEPAPEARPKAEAKAEAKPEAKPESRAKAEEKPQPQAKSGKGKLTVPAPGLAPQDEASAASHKAAPPRKPEIKTEEKTKPEPTREQEPEFYSTKDFLKLGDKFEAPPIPASEQGKEQGQEKGGDLRKELEAHRQLVREQAGTGTKKKSLLNQAREKNVDVGGFEIISEEDRRKEVRYPALNIEISLDDSLRELPVTNMSFSGIGIEHLGWRFQKDQIITFDVVAGYRILLKSVQAKVVRLDNRTIGCIFTNLAQAQKVLLCTTVSGK